MSFILNLKKYNLGLLAVFFAVISLNSFSQEVKGDSQYKQELKHIEIPKIQEQEHIISHSGYSFSYNKNYKQANWVAYELTQEKTKSIIKRTNKFLIDATIELISADNVDYSKSGYDRGHLAPAADMAWSESSMKESFFFSNISPQVPSFNRGIWKQAEELVRDWAKEYQKVYVVTGPIFSKDMKSIGPHQVAVPKYFYKVILRYNGNENFGIGFIIPNARSGEALQTFAKSIDAIELSTGIDFFPSLPDNIENHIESDLDLNSWIWQHKKNDSKKKKKTYLN